MSQWAAFSRFRGAFHLYVPASMIDVARQLCVDLQIPVGRDLGVHGHWRPGAVHARPANVRAPGDEKPQPASSRAAARRAPAAERSRPPAVRAGAPRRSAGGHAARGERRRRPPPTRSAGARKKALPTGKGAETEVVRAVPAGHPRQARVRNHVPDALASRRQPAAFANPVRVPDARRCARRARVARAGRPPRRSRRSIRTSRSTGRRVLANQQVVESAPEPRRPRKRKPRPRKTSPQPSAAPVARSRRHRRPSSAASVDSDQPSGCDARRADRVSDPTGTRSCVSALRSARPIPLDREALMALAERLNPAAWTDADQIAEGLSRAAEALERLSRVLLAAAGAKRRNPEVVGGHPHRTDPSPAVRLVMDWLAPAVLRLTDIGPWAPVLFIAHLHRRGGHARASVLPDRRRRCDVRRLAWVDHRLHRRIAWRIGGLRARFARWPTSRWMQRDHDATRASRRCMRPLMGRERLDHVPAAALAARAVQHPELRAGAERRALRRLRDRASSG